MKRLRGGMRMGLVGPGLMGTGGVLIAYGMVGPPTGDGTLKIWSLGLGAITAGIGAGFEMVQGNDKGGKGKK